MSVDNLYRTAKKLASTTKAIPPGWRFTKMTVTGEWHPGASHGLGYKPGVEKWTATALFDPREKTESKVIQRTVFGHGATADEALHSLISALNKTETPTKPVKVPYTIGLGFAMPPDTATDAEKAGVARSKYSRDRASPLRDMATGRLFYPDKE